MKPRAGDRVRVRPKHAVCAGAGWWGLVVERQGRTRSLVIVDGGTKRCQVHDADVVEIAAQHKSAEQKEKA